MVYPDLSSRCLNLLTRKIKYLSNTRKVYLTSNQEICENTINNDNDDDDDNTNNNYNNSNSSHPDLASRQ